MTQTYLAVGNSQESEAEDNDFLEHGDVGENTDSDKTIDQDLYIVTKYSYRWMFLIPHVFLNETYLCNICDMKIYHTCLHIQIPPKTCALKKYCWFRGSCLHRPKSEDPLFLFSQKAFFRVRLDEELLKKNSTQTSYKKSQRYFY